MSKLPSSRPAPNLKVKDSKEEAESTNLWIGGHNNFWKCSWSLRRPPSITSPYRFWCPKNKKQKNPTTKTTLQNNVTYCNHINNNNNACGVSSLKPKFLGCWSLLAQCFLPTKVSEATTNDCSNHVLKSRVQKSSTLTHPPIGSNDVWKSKERERASGCRVQ
jgi:hypothetical protein